MAEPFDTIAAEAGVTAFPALARGGRSRQWHEVTGGALGERRVMVRLGRNESGALVCTGVLLGLDGEELTGASLRDVPVTAIVRRVGEMLVEREGDDEWDEVVRMALVETLGANIADPPRRRPGHRGRGGEGPSDGDLAAFMRALSAAGGTGRHGAMSRAARGYGVDRSTAYRWLALARRKGITGQEEQA